MRQHNKNFVKNTTSNGILQNMYTIHAPMIFAGTGGEVMHSDHSLT